MNTPLVILNVAGIALAVWLVVASIACLIHPPKNRDLRPLVLPIFCSLAYVSLRVQSLVVLTTCENPVLSSTVILDRVVEGGFLFSMYLFVQGFKHKRCERTDCCE